MSFGTGTLLLLMFSVNQSAGQARRCLLLGKQCVTHCPRNMHAYHTRCDRDTYSQRTCDFPEIYNLGYTCGWSRCDCNGDFVLDDDFTCVDYKRCSKFRRAGLRTKSKKKLPSKVKIEDDNKPIDF